MILGSLLQIRAVNRRHRISCWRKHEIDDHACQFLTLIFLQKMTRSLYRRMRLIASSRNAWLEQELSPLLTGSPSLNADQGSGYLSTFGGLPKPCDLPALRDRQAR